MKSLRIEFARISIGRPLSFTFWLAVFAVAIDDDRQKSEKERRKKRERAAKAQPPKPGAPRPF